MSKVLVDRELLEKWADKLEGADFASYGWGNLMAAEVRGAIAQPAEAEGVEVVAYADPKAFENFKTLGSKGGVHGHEWMWAKPDGGLVGMVRQSDHLAALSAVTAERDRLQEALNFACKALCQVTSSDGSGHADIALSVLRLAGVGAGEREALVEGWKANVKWRADAAMAAKEA